MPHDLITKYFNQELSAEEQKSFDHLLATDPAFAKAFQVEKDIMAGVESVGNERLRADLQKIHQEEIASSLRPDATAPVKALPPLKTNRRWWMIAAAAAVAVVLLSWLFWPQPSPQQLYAQYAQHDFDFTEKSSEAPELAAIESHLKSGQFQQAIPLINEYLTSSSQNNQLLLAQGIAYLEMDDHEKAVLTFKQVTRVNKLYKIEGTWYQALAHLKGNNLTLCRQLLHEIPPETARYAVAQELLKKIEE